MADNDDKGNSASAGENDDKGAATPPPPTDLDTVHEQIQNDRGDELRAPEFGEDEDTTDGDSDENAADDDEQDDPGSGSSDDKDDGDDTGDGADDEQDDSTGDDASATGDEDSTSSGDAADNAEEEDVPTPPEQDDDIAKPGKYKAEFVDEEGKKYYVSDMDQLPDDFEPRSQKEYGKAIQDLTKKQLRLDADQKQYDQDKASSDTKVAVKKLRDSWNSDIDRLTKEKVLPEDSKKREKVVEGVYQLMAAEMKQGRTIDNWAHAHELYEAREAKKAAASQTAADEVARTKEKKEKGGKVMGSGSGGSPNKPKVMEGPPPGVGLDAVHEKVMSSLNN